MIDNGTLRQMGDRADVAARVIGALDMCAPDGLLGEQRRDAEQAAVGPAVASARDVPALIAEVRRLEPASYIHGPEACCLGECDHDLDDDGCCPTVEYRVATLGHVWRAEVLGELVELLDKAGAAWNRGEEWVPGRSFADYALEQIADAYERIEQREREGEG